MQKFFLFGVAPASVIVLLTLMALGPLLKERAQAQQEKQAHPERERPIHVEELPLNVIFQLEGKSIDLKGQVIHPAVGEINGKKEVIFIIHWGEGKMPFPNKFVYTKRMTGEPLLVSLDP